MSQDWQGVSPSHAEEENRTDRVPAQPVFAIPSHRDNEDQGGLGLETGHVPYGFTNHALPPLPDFNNPFQSMSQPQYQPQPSTSGYRPPLELDTAGPSYTHQPQQSQLPLHSAQSSAPSTGYGTGPSSITDGESVITPGMQFGFPGYSTGPPQGSFPDPGPMASNPSNPFGDPSQSEWFSSFLASYQPSQPPPPQPQNTISPHQFAPDFASNPPKPFNHLLLGSRGSTSSASSTDGGQDWQPQQPPGAYDNWRPMEQTSRQSTIPQRQKAPTTQEQSDNALKAMWDAQHPPSLPPTVPHKPMTSAEIQQMLRQYLSAPSRLAFGERKLVISSPKVGQKSYGSEKRFLCPHPQATLYGPTWWNKNPDECPVSTSLPPKITMSLVGENPPKESPVSWTTLDGQNLDEKINTQAIRSEDQPFMGHVVGKNLHITDSDTKRKEVKAVVTVKPPPKHYAGPNGWGPSKGTVQNIESNEIIGTFESKEIKVISKPSKKKASSKSGELLIQHGTTVALFNRVKSQTTSTRYLSVDADMTTVLGSDGRPMIGAQPPNPTNKGTAWESFTAGTNVWESWIIWLVDPRKPSGPGYDLPLHPGWPSAPANAISPGPITPAIRYNSLVVLQSLQTGRFTPTLVIRRVDQDADVVGGDGTLNEQHACFPEGEAAGDLVAQLQKCAFEVYRPDTMLQLSRDPRFGGYWLSCDQDTIQDKYVNGDRKWSTMTTPTPRGSGAGSASRPSSVPSTPSQRFGILPMTPHLASSNLPSTPSSPTSNGSSVDYFGSHSRKPSSTSLISPPGGQVDATLPNMDGGPVRRQRAGSSSRGPLVRPAHKKRQSVDSSAGSSWEMLSSAATGHSSSQSSFSGATALPSLPKHQSHGHGGHVHPMVPPSMSSGGKSASPEVSRSYWTLDVGETCIWSIVSTEQKTYTYYVPPQVMRTCKGLEAFVPFPEVTRALPPGEPGEHPHVGHTYTPSTDLPLATLYGTNFSQTTERNSRYKVWYGDQEAEYSEFRCPNVMGASEPPRQTPGQALPITLVRHDGYIVVPTPVQYLGASGR